MTTTLRINKLSFERNDVTLLHDINCDVTAGSALQIRGANGSGKSTLLRLLAAYLEPHAGSIQWQGRCIFQQGKDYQQQLHYLGHLSGIKQNLSVLENLQLHLSLSGLTRHADTLESAMTRMGLHAYRDTPAKNLSAGLLRRLALTRLVIHTQAIWILDEPLTALDLAGQTLFNTLLQEHLQSGGIAMIATHHDLHVNAPLHTLDLGGAHA